MPFSTHPSLRLLPLLGGAGLIAALAASAATAQTPVSSPVIELDELIVSASPLARTADDLNQSVSLLTGRDLAMKRAPSLGETLDGSPGVASSWFGPGASRPIIRGLGGERIRVLTNGLGTIDVSPNSPDHAVSLEPALVERIEVVRGASTLLYGNSAVGGVVNVVDQHLPTAKPDHSLEGLLEVRHGAAADEKTGLGTARGATGSLAWQVSLMRRTAGDYEIPGAAESEHAHEHHEADEDHESEESVVGILPNSALETTSGSGGFSWFWKGGFAGVAFSSLDTSYGVPGHSHGHEHEEHEEEGGEHEAAVTIDLAQRRWDFQAEMSEPFGVFRSARFRLGVADYEHTEFEGDEVGTRFDHTGWEGRLDLLHRPVGPFDGVVGLQMQRGRLSAEGDEAYVPPTRTLNRALFVLEEAVQGPVRWQVGARLENHDIDRLDDTPVHRHKNAWSFSGGGVVSLSDEWALAFSLARTERIPTAQELFANGPHAATRSFEIGDPGLGKEQSTGIDLALRRRVGSVTGSISVFSSRVDRFIFSEPTSDTEDGFRVFRSVAKDAGFRGAELEAAWHVHEKGEHTLDVTFVADLVRAENRTDNTPLPRIPPMRVAVGIAYASPTWSAGAEVRRVSRQDRVTSFETETGGYTLASAYAAYTFPARNGVAFELFVRGSNLTDEEARPHTSFLKDLAPLPGRDVTLGARLLF